MATLNIRAIDDDAAARAKRAAEIRGLTIGQYVAKLVALHDVARQLADSGDETLQAELTAIGLQTISG